jgi:hypothetical protein
MGNTISRPVCLTPNLWSAKTCLTLILRLTQTAIALDLRQLSRRNKRQSRESLWRTNDAKAKVDESPGSEDQQGLHADLLSRAGLMSSRSDPDARSVSPGRRRCLGGLHDEERRDDRDAIQGQIQTEAKRSGEEGRQARLNKPSRLVLRALGSDNQQLIQLRERLDQRIRRPGAGGVERFL